MLVDLFQSLYTDMGINLSGGQAGMSQELLYDANIRPPVQNVRGERVPKRMGRDLLTQIRLLQMLFQ